jgi:hypothetical protein
MPMAFVRAVGGVREVAYPPDRRDAPNGIRTRAAALKGRN